MANKENKSSYWIKKWQEAGWSDYTELEVGSVFNASVSNHKQMADRIGDIIFWYKSDSSKGIYFITQVVSAPYPGDNNTGHWMDCKVLKTIIDNPVKPENHKILNKLMEKINKMGQGGGTYNLTFEDEPEKIYDLIKGNEEIELKEDGVTEINLKDLEEIEKIKETYIKEDDNFFNPFVDTDLAKSEVRHLNFITNLINPNGSHMQNDTYLKLFIDELLAFENLANDENLQKFCSGSNIHVQTEYNIGNGRIDMWLENDDFIIAIEGKTETQDHDGQLKKYDDFLQKQNKPYLLFYLTKFSEAPKFKAPDTVVQIGFYDTILPFVKKVLSVENLPDNISFAVTDYCNALDIYLNELNTDWAYGLNIVKEITKDKDSYDKYSNIARNYYRDMDKFKNSVVEDIANNFELAKAKIERNFFGELLNSISADLEKEGFVLNVDFDDDGLDLAIDLNTISKARIKRLAMYDENKDLMSGSKFAIQFVNTIDDNEYLFLNIQNDIYGLHVFFNHIKENEEVNIFEENDKVMIEPNIFYSNNIAEFLDKDYISKHLKECKSKILNELKQIEI